MALAASLGTIPASARVSVAATSTASQVRKRFSSLQRRAISGRVYRGIKTSPSLICQENSGLGILNGEQEISLGEGRSSGQWAVASCQSRRHLLLGRTLRRSRAEILILGCSDEWSKRFDRNAKRT